MPEKPLLEYANRLKSFWLFPVVFIFFVSALFSLIQLKQSIAILDKRHDTSVWTIFQLKIELQRFHDSLIIYEKDQSTLVELQERYDILWSRFPVILNSIDGERLSESNGSIEIVEHAFAEVKALEPVIFEELALNPALTSSIRLRIRPHLEAITILSLDNYLKHNDYLSRSDDRVTGLQEKLIWLMFGLILSGSLLLLMVLRENRFNLYQAEHDSLTGMPNRAYLRRVLSDRCGIGQPYALHLIDLNGFKDINDTLGHHAGDLVLQAVAKRLKDKIDNFFDCVTCRLGGDEFAIVQFDVMTKKQLNTLASQVVSVLSEEFDLGEHQCHIGASIGSSLYPDHGRDGSSLLSHADIAMYQAKVNAPESTHKLFSYQMLEQINRRQQLQRELRNAIHNGELHLEYQPIVCLQKNKISSLEALLRWHHPIYNAISPLEVIDIAEQYGITEDLGHWLVSETASQIKSWKDSGIEPVPVSINISPSMYQMNLVEIINSALESNGLPQGLIWIEITEDTSLEIINEVQAMLPDLAAEGIKASLDDFGTGLSSLSHLRQLSINAVKIDRSFIGNLEQDKKSRDLVRHIINIGHDLGIKVVAEGIEDQYSNDFLFDSQCDYAQGYYYSRPQKPEAIGNLLCCSVNNKT